MSRLTNAEYRRRADAAAVELQCVVATIRADYPAAAFTVDSASVLLGVLAGRLAGEGEDSVQLLREALVKLDAASAGSQFACNLRRRIERHLGEIQA